MTDQITVRFDVIGWNAADRDNHASDIETIRNFVSGAVMAGLDSVDISAEIHDFSDALLFSDIHVARTDREDGSIVMSVICLAAGMKVAPVADVIDIRNYLVR